MRRLAVALAWTCTACGSQLDGGSSNWSSRDSLGVEIVESLWPAWGESSPWTISEVPVLTIGSSLSDESQALYDVGDVRRLSDGRIAVANSGTRQIRLYDAEGTHLSDVGREGDGPGEFRRPRSIWFSLHDTMSVYDGVLERLTVFAPDMSLARTVQPSSHEGSYPPTVLGALGDGQLLVESLRPASEGPRRGRFSTGVVALLRYGADGEYLNEIAEVGPVYNWGFSTAGGEAWAPMPFSLTRPPSATGGDGVYVATGSEPSIERRTTAGQVIQLIRWSEEPVRVDDRAKQRYGERQMGDGRSEVRVRMVQDLLDGLEFPESLPLFEALLIDAEGYLWVKRYRPGWVEEQRWWVFSPEGVWLGQPPVPTDLDIREIGAEYVLGVRRDETDVENVVMYSINRLPL